MTNPRKRRLRKASRIDRFRDFLGLRTRRTEEPVEEVVIEEEPVEEEPVVEDSVEEVVEDKPLPAGLSIHNPKPKNKKKK